eukprot:TRINITY_DN802_c0_g2_i2.p1 TRINITY_DN802_c0_g2~~TRINITY_DN802_c0_g2_i2.p1  ORF type:complete len:456 (+),score=136.50 TRINITY_DN802_c0_g2_i2:234-1601(+)
MSYSGDRSLPKHQTTYYGVSEKPVSSSKRKSGGGSSPGQTGLMVASQDGDDDKAFQMALHDYVQGSVVRATMEDEFSRPTASRKSGPSKARSSVSRGDPTKGSQRIAEQLHGHLKALEKIELTATKAVPSPVLSTPKRKKKISPYEQNLPRSLKSTPTPKGRGTMDSSRSSHSRMSSSRGASSARATSASIESSPYLGSPRIASSRGTPRQRVQTPKESSIGPEDYDAMRPQSASASVRSSHGPGVSSRRRRMRHARLDDERGRDEGDEIRSSTSFDFRREEEDADIARRKANARIRRKQKTEKVHEIRVQKSIDSRLMLQKDVIESKVQEANDILERLGQDRHYQVSRDSISRRGVVTVSVLEEGDLVKEISSEAFDREFRVLKARAGSRDGAAISSPFASASSPFQRPSSRALQTETKERLQGILLDTIQLTSKLRDQLNELDKKGGNFSPYL